MKFIHVRVRDDSQVGGLSTKGGFTIGYKEIGESEDLVIEWGLAVCSPKDRYEKKLGRDVSTGRLVKGDTDSIHVMFDPSDTEDRDTHVQKSIIDTLLKESPDIGEQFLIRSNNRFLTLTEFVYPMDYAVAAEYWQENRYDNEYDGPVDGPF